VRFVTALSGLNGDVRFVTAPTTCHVSYLNGREGWGGSGQTCVFLWVAKIRLNNDEPARNRAQGRALEATALRRDALHWAGPIVWGGSGDRMTR